MPTSGTYTWSPEIAEVVDEAFERCGVDPASLTQRHTRSARMSLNLMLSDWSNAIRGVPLWTVVQNTQLLTDGDPTYDAPAGTTAVLDVYVRRDGIDTPVFPISREEYYSIPDKTTEGLPTMYWFNKGASTRTINLWQVPENSTDTLVYTTMRRLQDVLAQTETLDVPYEWHEAFTADLAWRLALKFAPERMDRLIQLSDLAFKRAATENRERAPTVFRAA